MARSSEKSAAGKRPAAGARHRKPPAVPSGAAQGAHYPAGTRGDIQAVTLQQCQSRPAPRRPAGNSTRAPVRRCVCVCVCVHHDVCVCVCACV